MKDYDGEGQVANLQTPVGFPLDSISYLHGIPLKGMNGDVANAVGDDLGILKEVDIPADDVSWAGGSV
ncbi:hypothetical protein CMV_029630 [Castanea mollissima]|uniref:Uncharacterized protein n=1 Tax=Castanea mollissima TaxID=60419 RepID=A0A8J4Q6E5_9ROSI|nr:hypothetical protein CMV_029630 [Castanea mollissima]